MKIHEILNKFQSKYKNKDEIFYSEYFKIDDTEVDDDYYSDDDEFYFYPQTFIFKIQFEIYYFSKLNDIKCRN